MSFLDVKDYIAENIFHSETFDVLSSDMQVKAVKNAESILYTMFRSYKTVENPMPVNAIAYQTLWIIAKDSAIQKAEMGITSQSIEGMSQSFRKMDRILAPEVRRILQKKVGRYNLTVEDTFRGVYR
jgi:predicted lipoprotein